MIPTKIGALLVASVLPGQRADTSQRLADEHVPAVMNWQRVEASVADDHLGIDGSRHSSSPRRNGKLPKLPIAWEAQKDDSASVRENILPNRLAGLLSHPGRSARLFSRRGVRKDGRPAEFRRPTLTKAVRVRPVEARSDGDQLDAHPVEIDGFSVRRRRWRRSGTTDRTWRQRSPACTCGRWPTA